MPLADTMLIAVWWHELVQSCAFTESNGGISMRRLVSHVELVLFVALIALGLFLMASQPWGIDKASAAGLAGALFGGAALLLGNLINRANDRFKVEQEQVHRVKNIKTLIAAELVDVTCGLISAKRLVDAAITTLHANGSVSETLDMSPYRPRQMPFTDSLGIELIALEKGAVDAIATLRSNLAVTRQSLDEVTAGARFGLLRANSLSNGLAHDMTILAEVFTHIAPTRRLQLPGTEQAELATEVLRRAARPPEVSRN